MFLKLSEIPDNYCCIYKLNYPNKKYYIGQTQNLKRRMWEHNNTNKAVHPCDLAIAKYGKITEIEILEEKLPIDKLDEREIYWINFYDATNKEKGYNLTKGGKVLRGEDSPRAVFTNKEVLQIRKLKAEGMRKIDVYNNFFSHHNFRGFEGVWWGKTYQEIGKEYLEQTKDKDWNEYSSIINGGTNSHKAKLTKEQVLEIRARYDNGERPFEILRDFPFVSHATISRVCKRETYKNI